MLFIRKFFSHLLSTRLLLLKWLTWFTVGNIFLFWLIGTQFAITIMPLNVATNFLVGQTLAWTLFITGFIGHLSLLALLPALLLFIPLILISYRIPLFIISSAVIIFSSFASLLLIDAWVFKQFHYHLNGILLELAVHKDAYQVFGLSWLEYSFAILGCSTIFCLETIYAIYLWRKPIVHFPLLRLLKYLAGTLGSLLFSYYLFILAEQYETVGLNKAMLALPLYENCLNLLLPKSISLTHLSMLGYGNLMQLDYANHKLFYPLQPLKCKPLSRPPNLVIIVIDTWRFDMVNPIITPHIWQFAKHNWQFTQHFSGGNATQPGIFSLFYGLPTNYWTATIKQHKSPVLINEMLQRDYQTGIFTSATLALPAFNANIFQAIKNLQLYAPGRTAAERDLKLTQQFKQFITQANKAKQPFFSFLFYDSAHSYCDENHIPEYFKPTLKVCNRLAPIESQNIPAYFNRYKNSLYFIDKLIGNVLVTLKDQQLLDNTVILITGDHGEEFNDNHTQVFGHASNFTRYQLQTPLVIHWPGKTSQRVNYPTNHYDIAPTLLTQLFGCTNPISDYSIGNSLLKQQKIPYLLAYSYINFALIEPNRITTILPTGNYQIDNTNGLPLIEAKLNVEILKNSMQQMLRFTQVKAPQ